MKANHFLDHEGRRRRKPVAPAGAAERLARNTGARIRSVQDGEAHGKTVDLIEQRTSYQRLPP